MEEKFLATSVQVGISPIWPFGSIINIYQKSDAPSTNEFTIYKKLIL